MTTAPDDAVLAHPETLVDALERRAAADPDGELVRFPGVGALTAAGCWTAAEALAGVLRGPVLGLPAGAPVATCLTPGPRVVEALFGVARAGLVEVPLPVDVPPDQAAALLRACRVRAVLVGDAVLDARPELARLAEHAPLLTVAEGGPPPARPGPPSLDDLLADRAAHGAAPPRPGPGDPALVMATSGTSGQPKGALLPHFAGVRHARRVAHSLGYHRGDVLLNFFPWNHINVRHAGLGAALVSGARLVAAPRFSASPFWELCRTESVTAFNFMGAVAAILLRRPPGPADRDHQVTRAYGGPAPRELAAAFEERFGVRLLEAYACTELGDVTSNTLTDHATGTAGRPLPEYRLAVTDPRGRPAQPGEVGDIAVRARARHVAFLGYVGRPDLAPLDADGWFRTGDRGHLDGDGRLHFAGRHGDVIRRRGENIPCAQIETAIAALPGVQEVAAVGVTSELTEQDALAVVVLAPGAELTTADIHRWCRDRLPRHAVPRYLRLADRLPRNAATKVRRADLRADRWLAGADDFDSHRPTGAADHERTLS